MAPVLIQALRSRCLNLHPPPIALSQSHPLMNPHHSLFPPPFLLPPLLAQKESTPSRQERGKMQAQKGGETAISIKSFNLSKHPVSRPEETLLARGLTFAPTTPPNPFTLFLELNQFIRNITVKCFFNLKEQNNSGIERDPSSSLPDPSSPIDNFQDCSVPERLALDHLELLYTEDLDDYVELLTQHLSSSPPIQQTRFQLKSIFYPTFDKGPYIQSFYQVIYTEILHMCQQIPIHTRLPSNLLRAETLALNQLTDDNTLVIRSADKGGGIVVQDLEDYQLESRQHLSDSTTYRKLTSDPLPIFSKEAHDLVNKAHIKDFLLRQKWLFSYTIFTKGLISTIFLKSTRTQIIHQVGPLSRPWKALPATFQSTLTTSYRLWFTIFPHTLKMVYNY